MWENTRTLLGYKSGALVAETAGIGFPQHALHTACGEYLVIAEGTLTCVVELCARTGAHIEDKPMSFYAARHH